MTKKFSEIQGVMQSGSKVPFAYAISGTAAAVIAQALRKRHCYGPDPVYRDFVVSDFVGEITAAP